MDDFEGFFWMVYYLFVIALGAAALEAAIRGPPR